MRFIRTGQENNIAQPQTDKWFSFHLIFHYLTVVCVVL